MRGKVMGSGEKVGLPLPPSPWESANGNGESWELAIGNGESGRKTSPHRTPPRFFFPATSPTLYRSPFPPFPIPDCQFPRGGPGGEVVCRFPGERVVGRGALPYRARRDPDLPGLAAERASVVERMAMLRLPLVHHLVQQRMHHLRPWVTADMGAADGDVGRLTGGGGRGVLAQPASHTARHADADRLQRTAEVAGVERFMTGRERADVRAIRGTHALGASRSRSCLALAGFRRIREDDRARGSALGSRAPADESRDGPVYVIRRAQIALVNPQGTAVVAHHDGPVPCETAALDVPEPHGAQPR